MPFITCLSLHTTLPFLITATAYFYIIFYSYVWYWKVSPSIGTHLLWYSWEHITLVLTSCSWTNIVGNSHWNSKKKKMFDYELISWKIYKCFLFLNDKLNVFRIEICNFHAFFKENFDFRTQIFQTFLPVPCEFQKWR